MLINIAIGSLVPLASILLVFLFTLVDPSTQWTTRVGGLMIGLAVFMQGYVWANPEKFSKRLISGLTLEQRIIHISYVVAVYGTLLNTFGDLLPPIAKISL